MSTSIRNYTTGFIREMAILNNANRSVDISSSYCHGFSTDAVILVVVNANSVAVCGCFPVNADLLLIEIEKWFHTFSDKSKKGDKTKVLR
ncbi:Hypothetical predicted protein [Octopus vulgaris]|uniref:Uncharacterized protein n=1 Tax=Octopus vulgaris TaxID=6645 RepID=A0AA36AXT5_OCTVU|nr:Hypothetical predicted protein [Octopus vulgaris]